MNKSLLGFAPPIFFLLAGVLMIAGGKGLVGGLFIGLSVISFVIRLYMMRRK